MDSGSRGLKRKRWRWCRDLFSGREAHCFSVDEVVSAAGLSGRPPPVAIWSRR
ncbi:hypothetical protein LNP20_18790 [Klebsiella pneumoniae subsp. pneumoniae]|nr:hypothetical protein [Klebsiella pneumoniae subsp. pneumoniae]